MLHLNRCDLQGRLAAHASAKTLRQAQYQPTQNIASPDQAQALVWGFNQHQRASGTRAQCGLISFDFDLRLRLSAFNIYFLIRPKLKEYPFGNHA